MAGIKTIRDNLTGTFSKIIVGAIAVTFAMFFGWGTMFSNSDVNIIASVNGEKIDLYDLDLEMARVQSILAQRFEDPDFTVEEETLKSLALNSLITDALILDFLKQNQIEVLDLTAYKLLSKNEIFQDNGEFSLGKVNTFARQNGFLPGKYIESISDDIAINYWRMGLGASSFITSKELNQNIKLANQTRDVTFTKINQVEIEGSIKLTDEEVLNFFEENPSLFQSEEKAKVNFIEISLKDLEEKLLIDEVVIKNEYQAYLDSFDSTIRRSASHLMLNIYEERNEEEALLLAEEIKEKIESGIDFRRTGEVIVPCRNLATLLQERSLLASSYPLGRRGRSAWDLAESRSRAIGPGPGRCSPPGTDRQGFSLAAGGTRRRSHRPVGPPPRTGGRDREGFASLEDPGSVRATPGSRPVRCVDPGRGDGRGLDWR